MQQKERSREHMHRRNVWLLITLSLAVLFAGAWGARTFAAQSSGPGGSNATPPFQVRHPDEGEPRA